MLDLHDAAERLLAWQDDRAPSMETLRAAARARRRRRQLVAGVVAVLVLFVGTVVVLQTASDQSAVPVSSDPAWSVEHINRPDGTPPAESCVRLTVASVTRQACVESRGEDLPAYWRVAGRDFVLFTHRASSPAEDTTASGASRLIVQTAERYLAEHATPHGLMCGATLGTSGPAWTLPIVTKIGDALEADFGTATPPIEIYGCSREPPRIHGLLGTTPTGPTTAQTVTITADGEQYEAHIDASPAECANPSGTSTVTVPNVVGMTLPDAIATVEAAGLNVIDNGTPPGDPTDESAIVTAQEPDGIVPTGACIGFRTK